MSVIPPALSRNLQFYLSGPAPCPYLTAQIERKLFTRLDQSENEQNANINSALCRAGFRRSHDVVYRPACPNCNACVPVRIAVRLFISSRSLKRVKALNHDLTFQRGPCEPSDELYALFSTYQKSRHGDSVMARMSETEFAGMLREGNAGTFLYLMRDQCGVLKGCMIADAIEDGFSAVYSFFDPLEPRRSLGTYLILALIMEAEANNLPFIYLGYWIAMAKKMAYKARFHPLQALGPQGWDWMS